MTAFDTRDVKKQAHQLEVDEYFSKPFDLSKIIRTVDELIGVPVAGAGDDRGPNGRR
jgi:YesN/AraC family two-component response regulator